MFALDRVNYSVIAQVVARAEKVFAIVGKVVKLKVGVIYSAQALRNIFQ